MNAAIVASGCCGVVNIDPVFDRLPTSQRTETADPVPAMIEFGEAVVDAVAGVAPIVKFNIAYFERYGAPGFDGYRRLIAHAHRRQLLVIGDVKRGDIGSTASAYADGHFALADALTLHPYLGEDSVAPFLDACGVQGKSGAGGKAVFALDVTDPETFS
ncbi:MAG: orotidine-5'-phosphate decarboxylase, partial [Phycisphaerales bacterium]|nr:orotidine-5'-phosphate decarboxylase [Phycisphaerales bacterium]